MSTKLIKKYTKDVVNDLIDKGKMFTAYDVTRIVRGAGIKCYHNQVRDIVHELYREQKMDCEYGRNAIDINGASPYVYHHYMDDPNTYDPNVLVPKDDSDVTDQLEKDSAFVNADHRGRIYIGPNFIRKLDVEPGDTVYVYSVANGEIIVSDLSPSLLGVKTYTVDKDNAIRIGLSVHRAAGLKGEIFEVSFEGGSAGRFIFVTK